MRSPDMRETDVIRHHLGELRASESEEVKRWAEESEENSRQYNIYKKIIVAISSLHKWNNFHWKKAWRHISSRL